MFKFIDFRIFLITLAIGLFYIYIAGGNKKILVIYPTPDNIHEYQYKDKANNCFSYDLNEVTCPADSKLLHDVAN